LRKAFSLADELEALWDEAKRAVEVRRIEPLDARRAVVFRLTRKGPAYSSSRPPERATAGSFRRGMSRNEETAAVTALREVAEEAGVRARPIGACDASSRSRKGMDLHRVLSDGLRRPHDAAREAQDPLARLRRSDRALDLAKSRRVLRSADRLISVPLRHHIRSAAARSRSGSCERRSRSCRAGAPAAVGVGARKARVGLA